MAERGASGVDHLLVGRIRRPHGVAGEVLIAVDTDRPRQVFRPGARLQISDAAGIPIGEAVTVAQLRPTTGGAILKLAEVSSRSAAEGLRGRSLWIPAEDAQPAGEGEFHYRELVGLVARAAGIEIGRVTDILVLPAGETLVVETDNGKEILVPFVKEMVLEIDLAHRVLTLDLPEGIQEL